MYHKWVDEFHACLMADSMLKYDLAAAESTSVLRGSGCKPPEVGDILPSPFSIPSDTCSETGDRSGHGWNSRLSPPPKNVIDFYWARLESGEIVLGYWNGNEMETADSAGDHEGLHTEQLEGWTHWHEIEPPKWSD